MANRPILNSREEHQTHFDTDAYLSYYYTSVEGFLDNSLHTLNEIFSSGDHTGVKLLDVGSGPCIQGVLSASRIFPEIYLSDYCDQNRQALELWRRKDQKAHDWTAVLEYTSKLEGISAVELEERTRRAVKEVLQCDVLADNILPPGYNDFDCVVSSACLEGACVDMTSYKASVRKLAGLLKPGGTVVLFTYLGDKWYRVGDSIFGALSLTKTDLTETFSEAGFTDLKFINEYQRTDAEKEMFKDHFCSEGYLFLTAKLSVVSSN